MKNTFVKTLFYGLISKVKDLEYRQLSLVEKKKLLTLDAIVREDNITQDDFFDTRENLEYLFDKEHYIHFGAFEECSLYGALRLALDQDKLMKYKEILGSDGKLCFFGHGIVHPDYRGEDIMTKLAGHAIAKADKEQCETVITIVHPKNVPGLGTVDKLKFRNIGYTKVVGRPNPYKLFAKEL